MTGIKYWLLRKQRGATATEYAIIIALIALVIIAGATLLGTNINTLFSTVAGKLP